MSKHYHKYPKRMMENPRLIRWVYLWNNVMLQKNWFIFRKLRRLLDVLPDDAIIVDAGSGEGHHIIPFAKAYPNLVFHGVDFEAENILFTKKYVAELKLNNTVFREANLLTFESETLVDLIYTVGVLDFIPQDEVVLQRFYDNLKSGGRLFIHTPINEHTIIPYMHKLRKRKTHYNAVYQRDRVYTKQEILGKLKKVGFQIEKVTPKIGTLGIISHELYSILLAAAQEQEKKSRVKHILLVLLVFSLIPILTILKMIDFLLKPKKANTLVIVAKKK